ncbi:LOW QUALITY PROTEIN: DNA repair protein XRCC2 [Aphomia sociella]
MATNNIKLESGVQLLARLTKKSKIENFYPALFRSGPKYNEFIEMFSEISMSVLLVDIICEALIPVKLGGPQLSVLIFNMGGSVNYDMLVNCVQKRLDLIYFTEKSDHSEEFKSLLQETLCNLYILEIYDATQFYTTVHNLENILTKHSDISLIIFDTLTAFYWSEQGHKITRMDLYLKNLLQIIRMITKDYKTTVLYTRPEYFSSSKNKNENLTSTSLPPTTEGVDYHIQLKFDKDF